MKKILLLLAVAILASCSDIAKDVDSADTSSDSGSVGFTATISSDSRVQSDQFELNDMISVTAFEEGATYKSDAAYTYNGKVFASEDPIVLKRESHLLSYIATYPVVDDLASTFSFTVQSDQSTGDNFELSDLLISTAEETNDLSPQLSFSHALSGMVVNFDNGNLAGGGELTIYAKATTAIDLDANSYAPMGDNVALTPAADGTSSYKVIIAPQTISAGSTVATYKLDGNTYTWRAKNNLEFEPGCSYEYDWIIDIESITLTSPDLVAAGSSPTLSVDILPENATYSDVTWSAKSGDYLTITPDGVITTIEDGTATVTVTVKVSEYESITKDFDIIVSSREVYEVGDYYPNAENPVGIVFEISNSGINGKVISLIGDEVSLANNSSASNKWLTFSTILLQNYGTDNYDGLLNMQTALSTTSGDISQYPIYNWVHTNLNGGGDVSIYASGATDVWYIPALQEIRSWFGSMYGVYDVSSWTSGAMTSTFTNTTCSAGNTDAETIAFNALIAAKGGNEINFTMNLLSSTEDTSITSSTVNYYGMYFLVIYAKGGTGLYTKDYSLGLKSAIQFRAIMAF